MNFNSIDWGTFMDWVVFTTCIVLIITVIFDITKSIKDKTKLSDEHQGLAQGQKNITEVIKENQYAISSENNKIRDIVSNIDKTIFAEKEKSDERYKNLNDRQKDIKKHIEAVSQLMKEVERLQTESVVQKNEILRLKQENKILQEQLINLQSPILPSQIPPTQDFGDLLNHYKKQVSLRETLVFFLTVPRRDTCYFSVTVSQREIIHFQK